jgi:hypothetical protein
MKLKLLFTILFFPILVAAQGARFDSNVLQQGTIGTATNAVLIPSGAIIKFCSYPANGVPCTNLATTYTSVTLATACPTSTQITLAGTNTCVSNTDTQGNWGVWVAADLYAYTVTTSVGNFGPYVLNLTNNILVRLQTAAGTALTSSNFSAPTVGGWGGTGSAISNITGTDTAFTFTMTAGTGPNVNPTETLTFANGPWASIATMTPQMVGGTGDYSDIQASNNLSSITLTYMGLPVATKTYTISVVIAGASNVTTSMPATLNPVVQNPTGVQTITSYPLTINNGGNSTQAYYSSWGPVSPFSLQVQGGWSSFGLNTPDVYFTRLDTTVGSGTTPPAGCTTQVVFSPCDEPVNRIDFSNRQTTGVIPNMIGLAVVGNGFADNYQPSSIFKGNFEIGIGGAMFDAAVANTVHMRNMNLYLGVEGLPTQLAGGGSTRSAWLNEMDLQNSSGTDAVFNGTVGNYTGGLSILSAGNSNTIGVSISGANFVAGKGFLDGINISSAVNCGICMDWLGGTNAAPIIGELIATPGTYGLVVGSGTIQQAAANSGVNWGSPTNGIVLDALGTKGTVETQNSNTLLFNAKTASSSASTWLLQQTGSDNIFHFKFGGVDKFLLDLNGNGVFAGNIAGKGTGAFTGTLNFGGITANRNYAMPDAGGTILVSGNGTSPIQTKRTSGCTTAASIGATCDTTVTWTTAFADTNYTATCSGDVVTSGVPLLEGIDISAAKAAASITVRTYALTAAAAQFTTIDCVAFHD